MTFSHKRVPSLANMLIFYNETIKEVKFHKHLGITLNCKLNWTDHINAITTACMKRVNTLKYFKLKLPRKTLHTIYITMIRSLVDYGIVLFSGQSAALMKNLERIQYQSALIITGAIKNTSYARLLVELGWQRIEDRACFMKVSLFYKALNGLLPPYMSNLIVNKCTRDLIGVRLRRPLALIPPFYRTDHGLNSFIPSACRLWNDLPAPLRQSTSLTSFKSNYKKLYVLCGTKGTSLGSRRLDIIHTRFRLNFTTLNSDLFERSIIDSPLCRCMQEPETYYHYFINCPTYNVSRIILFNAMRRIFDDAGLSLDAFPMELILNHIINGFQEDFTRYNIQLFAVVQNYIASTNRF